MFTIESILQNKNCIFLLQDGAKKNRFFEGKKWEEYEGNQTRLQSVP